MFTSRVLTDEQKQIDAIITRGNALIAIVFDIKYGPDREPVIDYSGIDAGYLDQLMDPSKNRPSRSVTFFGDVHNPTPYDISLISFEDVDVIPDDVKKNAELKNIPILIKRGTDKWIIYGRNYYQGNTWQEIPLDKLNLAEKQLLKYFVFDGRVIVKGDDQVDPHKLQNLYTLLNKFHHNLPSTINKMNLRTLAVHEHKPGLNRLTKHQNFVYTHTAKTPTSLIPHDPRYMELFACDYGIGFLWDINDCDLKNEKYVFKHNAGTDSCFHLDLNDSYELMAKEEGGVYRFVWSLVTAKEKIENLKKRMTDKPLATVAALRTRNNEAVKKQKPIAWNELVVGLPKKLIRAVFATQDDRCSRLRALKAMLHAKEKLGLENDLPVFILQPFYEQESHDTRAQRDAVYRFYSKEEQILDLKADEVDKKRQQDGLDLIKNQETLALLAPDKKTLDTYLPQLSSTADYTDKIPVLALTAEPEKMEWSKQNGMIALLWDKKLCIYDENNAAANLKTGTVDAIICCADRYDTKVRINALQTMQRIKKELNLRVDIPIYIIQHAFENNPSRLRIYSDIEQDRDLFEAGLKYPYSTLQQSNNNYRQSISAIKDNESRAAHAAYWQESSWVFLDAEVDDESTDKPRSRCGIM